MRREPALSRHALASPEYRPGRIPCLRCAHDFKSWDVRENRLCGRCREALDRDATPEPVYAMSRSRRSVD